MHQLEELAQRHKFSVDVLSELQRVYGTQLENVVNALKRPPERYFVRVNTLRTTAEDLAKRFLQKGWEAKRDETLEEALYFEISDPVEVPHFNKRIIVDKFAAESVLLGANVYAPGIKKCSGVRKGDLVSVQDHQDQVVGAGKAIMSENEILTFRKGLAVEVQYPMYNLPRFGEMKEFSEGFFYLQSFPAMITTRVLNPAPGDTIVDMTCSPGGKLSHLFQLTKGKANLIGFDRNKRKITITRSSLEHLGFSANLIIRDSRYLDIDFPNLRADKVLVDPPCSALGIRPKTYEFTSKGQIEALSHYQRQFLRTASRIVRENGLVVYSVCTITIQECEEVVNYAIEKCDLEPESQRIFVGSQGLSDRSSAAKLLQRFHPHVQDCGYFIALFRKRA